MGFFNRGVEKKKPDTGDISIELLHAQECAVCPLNRVKGNRHPHMAPTGNPHPDVYCLGEANGETEDRKGVQFVGKSGRFLRSRIPAKWESRLRWNNCVRTRPPDNRDPTHLELECCRPSVAGDIEESQPKVIMGFGNIPLWWALADTGINRWRGRRIPIKVGNHECWFFPMLHPSGILRLEYPKNEEMEFVFEWDLKNAFDSIDTLPDPVIHTVDDAQSNIEIVTGENSDDFKRAMAFIKECYNYKIVGLDYETNRLRPYAAGAKILSVALGHKDRAMAIPFDHPGTRFLPSQIRELKKAYEDFLYDAPCRKTAHQLSFEQEWSGYHFGPGCLRAQPWDDSVTQAYILDERPGTHSLDFLCLQYFGLNLKAISNVEREKLEHEQLSTVLSYNALDAKYHRLLYLVQRERIHDEGLDDLYDNHLRRVPTMVHTQLMGLPVDQSKVHELYDKYTSDLEFFGGEIDTYAAVEKFERVKQRKFNPAAHMDVKAVMANLGHFDLKSVDEKELKKIDHPISELILEWRGAAKMLSTYVIPLMAPEQLTERKEDPTSSCVYPDGLIHPIISTTRTRTSRTSSESPNEQNYPKHGDGKIVRSQIKHKFKKIVSFDFAGIQARNVAMESLDKALIKSFWDNEDIHRDWAEICAKLHPAWVTEGMNAFRTDKDVAKKYRQRAKNEFVFASFFGAHPKTTARSLGVPERVTEKMYDMFWDKFPDIRGWHEDLKTFYAKHGYVKSLSGFRRHAPVSSNELINSGIQADETIIVCSTMTRLSEMEMVRYQASMEVHDDLTFIWAKKDIERNSEIVAKEMTRIAFPWMGVVPIVVELSVGDDWSNMKEVAKFSSIEIWGHRRAD